MFAYIDLKAFYDGGYSDDATFLREYGTHQIVRMPPELTAHMYVRIQPGWAIKYRATY